MLDMEPHFALPYFGTAALKVIILALRKPKLHDEEYMKLRNPILFLMWAFTMTCVWWFLSLYLLKCAIFPPARSVFEPPPRPVRRMDLAKDAMTDFCAFGVLFYLGSLIFES